MRRILTAALTAGALLTAAFAPTATAAPRPGASGATPNCVATSLPVALDADGPADQTLWGQLCTPAGKPVPATVQVLVHGATYDHNYWDFPYEPETYSYVREAVGSGFATFAIDRLGSGSSSRPVSSALDLYGAGHTVHQVVQALRGGELGGRAFPKVVTVGHSMGSGAVWSEASTYHDVDGVIITGLTHAYNSQGRGAAIAASAPANLYPEWAGLDDGYLTTIPGTRGDVFYNTALADPQVIAVDEQLKQPHALGDLVSLDLVMTDGSSGGIDVPVLLAMGERDSLFCGADGTDCSTSAALQAAEAPFYGAAPSFTAYVLRQSGHDINLHPHAGAWYGVASGWVWKHVAS
ncbi:alpha/beta fold hydrolase [Yinghuangia sp. ASG 101]|uniref:alpha/beta fold hydrolase n=1 Tax=Yinghuangia sp. ASG 101 TaxID=2896848 RepID=UPI001E5A03B6|nr:alpha/beta fold hydrolase [Yinghuangia sp. ASG 101]UGQ12793.1 alpha/beta fold hydrolase [Yinghuangia sp. ASG 101]